jgi:hypothetical protein
MSKSSVKLALARYYQKQMGDNSRSPKRKNEKPEKIVEREVTAWCHANNIDVSIVECKGVYNQKTNTFLHGMTEPGYSDLSGNNEYGTAVFIELKAPGRRSTLRPKQDDFLVRKIKMGCFACVVDSSKLLHEIYYSWYNYSSCGLIAESKRYLMSQMPKRRQEKDAPLFE